MTEQQKPVPKLDYGALVLAQIRCEAGRNQKDRDQKNQTKTECFYSTRWERIKDCNLKKCVVKYVGGQRLCFCDVDGANIFGACCVCRIPLFQWAKANDKERLQLVRWRPKHEDTFKIPEEKAMAAQREPRYYLCDDCRVTYPPDGDTLGKQIETNQSSKDLAEDIQKQTLLKSLRPKVAELGKKLSVDLDKKVDNYPLIRKKWETLLQSKAPLILVSWCDKALQEHAALPAQSDLIKRFAFWTLKFVELAVSSPSSV
jgi:hypothetical protein